MPEVMSIEVDEEFDPRPPSSPFGLRGPDGSLNYGMIGGIAIAVLLVIMLIFVVVKPFSSEKAVEVSSWQPKDPTLKTPYLDTYAATSPMASSIQNALDAWAQYFTKGELSVLSSTFDLTGNQYAQLVASQKEIKKSLEPGDPAVVTLGPIGKVGRKADIFTVRVVVGWKKQGAETGKTFKWDIDMKADGSLYLLSTVLETNIKDKQAVDLCGAFGIINGLNDSDEVVAELKKFDGQARIDKTAEVYAIRAKTWGILLTVVAGTDSEIDVSAIVDDYQALADASSASTSLADLQKRLSSLNITGDRAAIDSRSVEECDGLDISKK